MTGTVGHLFLRATNLASRLKNLRKQLQLSRIYISLQSVIHITIGFLLIFNEKISWKPKNPRNTGNL